jgi:predicted GNAT family N-acyltransferase
MELAKGENSFVIVAKDNDKTIGVIAIIHDSHIALFFVDTMYQGKAIVKGLIAYATENALKRNPEISHLTVSSPTNSESFYSLIEFIKKGKAVDEDEMQFIPMMKNIE